MKQRRIISGFTLIEMMTAVGLIVIIIIGVAIVFQSVGKVVGLSQVTLRLMSDVRAVQQQMASDVAGMDRSGFLVIRSKVDPANSNRRLDQMCFIAIGAFPNRTGTKNPSPFTDRTVANAALVWWGQLVLEGAPGIVNAKSTADQTQELVISDLPSGGKDQEFILGRHCMLLLPNSPYSGGGVDTIIHSTAPINAYPDIVLGTQFDSGVAMGTGENNSKLPRITSSRICTASMTAGQVMQAIMTGVGSPRSAPRYEADNYCYRYKTLPSVWATEQQVGGATYLPNGYFRMHPIVQQGVASFAVEWTDGTSASGSSPLKWYGLTNAALGVVPKGDSAIEPSVGGSGDDYTAIFSFDNKSKWPKALRVRFRVTDQNDRLQGGREFVEVLKLPD